MSGFHGLYSVGSFGGALVMSGLLWLNTSAGAAALIVFLLSTLLLLANPALLPYGDDQQERTERFIWPGNYVLFLAVLAFIMMLAEGSMLDWSAVFLVDKAGMIEKNAGHRIHRLLDCDDNKPIRRELYHSKNRTEMDDNCGCAGRSEWLQLPDSALARPICSISQLGIGVSPQSALPTVTIKGFSSIDLDPESLQILPQRPAHTDGDLAVFLSSSDVLVMGDLFTNGSYPVIDESSKGTLRGMIEALDGLMPILNAETIVVSGHGQLADRKSLIEFHEGSLRPVMTASMATRFAFIRMWL